MTTTKLFVPRKDWVTDPIGHDAEMANYIAIERAVASLDSRITALETPAAGYRLGSVLSRQVPGGSISNATTGYASLLNTFSFTKQKAATKLRVTIMASLYCLTAAPQIATLGVNVNGVDTDVANYFFNAVADHRSVHGVNEISGLAAATYSVQPRWHNNQTTNAIQADANDLFCFTVEEVV